MFCILVDHAVGFGGKYGVQRDRVDRSAKGWSEHTDAAVHPSQADYKKGFGGKFGVDSENQDKVSIMLCASSMLDDKLDIGCNSFVKECLF